MLRRWLKFVGIIGLGLMLGTSVEARQATINPGIPVNSFSLVNLSAPLNGTSFTVPQTRGQVFTWQTTFVAPPDAISVVLQGSINGTDYFTVDTSTAVAGEIRSLGPVAVTNIRCRIASLTIGTGDDLTCRINLLTFQASVITGGTLTSNLIMGGTTNISFSSNGTAASPNVKGTDADSGIYFDTVETNISVNGTNFFNVGGAGASVTQGGLFLNGLLVSPTDPTLPGGAGFCTSPTIAGSNTLAFKITIGTVCAGSTGTITMPSNTNGWFCSFINETAPAFNTPSQTGGTSTTVTVTNYARTTGLAANWTDSQVLRISCTPIS